ncbi:MAG: NADH-quinone oxidoreductase subunit NuoK [Nitrososphaerota archaeon]|nr:NADH-quinone oxidoreductase subunit NuoK [Candidatus Calditenuaceae archaeon]MDW8072663.1 NADH-quinone oxidoreductase subunit NuoK [Nitrososphaerota archaeon]
MALSPTVYTVFAGIIFVIGIYTLATKRNIIKQLIGVELMINAAHLNFVVFAVNSPGGIDPYALAIVIFSIAAGAAVITVGVILVVSVYRTYGTMDLEALRRLRR